MTNMLYMLLGYDTSVTVPAWLRAHNSQHVGGEASPLTLQVSYVPSAMAPCEKTSTIAFRSGVRGNGKVPKETDLVSDCEV